MHVLSKNIAIIIGFILAVAILKVETTLLNISKLNLASKKIIEYYKFNRLDIINKNSILSVIINVYS